MGKLNKDAFIPLFGDWWSRIEPFYDAGKFEPIYEFLKKEGLRGVAISPLSTNTFRCFTETKFEDLRLVICGLSPYHTFKNGYPIADGILMSCSVTGVLQPSLQSWYSECEKQLYNGLNLHVIKDPDLSFLCRQGVLMYNASLTCAKNKAGSHISCWSDFTKYLFEEVLFGTGVPVVFLGREAAKFRKSVAPFTWVFEVSHPASASYVSADAEWDSENLFLKVNKVLNDMNGETIQWMKIDE